jgi:hypothetical protein
MLLSLHKSGEYITTEEGCLYRSTSHNFIYSTLHFCSQKKKLAAGIPVLAPWLASNLTYKKFWQQNEVKGILADGNTGNRLVVSQASSEDSFIMGAHFIYKAGSVNGDNHGWLNGLKFV